VTLLWAAEEREPRGGCERVLPTGAMHLVFRFAAPLRLLDPDPRVVGHAIVGGARSSAYVRDISEPASSVGAQLAPGASSVLLGAPAIALAERHTPLEDLWGAVTHEMHAQLEAAATPAQRIDVLEAMLLRRCPRVRGVHPAVACALARFADGTRVGEVAAETGYSHRGFATIFEREVGLAPKRWCRVQRLQRVLEIAAHNESWALIAAESGYADQSHLHRELRELGGLTPAAYRRAAPRFSHHVALPFPSRKRP
jgi:AraC-like DNA-binding protein